MNDPITSVAAITLSASEAAAQWVKNQQEPKPRNPWDAVVFPEHHLRWRSAFEVSLLRLSAGADA